MKSQYFLFFVLFCLITATLEAYAQAYKIIESTSDHIIVEFQFNGLYSVVDTVYNGKTYQKISGENYAVRNPGDPWLPEFEVIAGVPFGSLPSIKILDIRQTVYKNKFLIPIPEEDPELVKQDFEKINKDIYSRNEYFPNSLASLKETYVVRYANVLPVIVNPYQFNPVTRDLVYNSYVKIRVDYNSKAVLNFSALNDVMTDDFLKSSAVNYNEALNFTGRIISGDSPSLGNSYWYNSDKNYFKIYVKEENVYRLTYEELISAGVELGNSTPIDKLELFNDGKSVPIYVFDNNSDTLFNSGDYLNFIGYPASPTPYCRTNIYNLTNLYWFSYQSDSSGVHYQLTNHFTGSYNRTYNVNLTTIHFEKDSLYERLGYAPGDQRDFWFWDKATSRDENVSYAFVHYFDSFKGWFADSHYVHLKVAMQGMSNSGICGIDHKAYIMINNRPIGDIIWDGQTDVVFDKWFYASEDSIPIYPGNELRIEVRGDVCNDIDDEIRINWVDFEYWRGNSAFGKYFALKNDDRNGINRYGIFDWNGSDMRIFVPSKNRMMYLPNTTNYEQFTDTMRTFTEYFLASTDYFKTVDSIRADNPSDRTRS